jgi:hypothetical protein
VSAQEHFPSIFIGKQRWLPASVEEQDGFAFPKESFPDQIDHSRGGASGVDRIEQ